ncbi:MAG TPA: glycine--tRNA ligase [Lentisphaeria bacterium]|nr:MAG: glycine--tRNA ligase [Lentisphaerae bacterium GWF2_50_93]HCE47019.1 glycine--tRNA ligase [Lentisphaeria bacterium]
MTDKKSPELMEKIVTLCKRRGFIFQSSEIYGGINGFWDYGPYGTALKRAVEKNWWHEMVEKRDNVEGLDSTVICHPKVWKASGHLDKFGDMMTDCRDCKARHRVDQMEDPAKCPACGSKNLTPPREFNLMMKTYVGPVSDEEHVAYLRAETCQPIFVDFHLVKVAARKKLPFGIAQIGKAFRNEINPRNFTFRSREFSQMEMEFFCFEEDSMQWYEYWKNERIAYYKETLGFKDEDIKIHEHETLAHYAKAALDIEFQFPFGWGELEGVHHRGTWDMSRHQEFSGENMEYFEQEKNRKVMPTVVETSVGVDRTVLALLCHAYDEDTAATKKEGMEEDVRIVLHLPAKLAPVQIAVLPLSNKLSESAGKVSANLKKYFRAEFDVTGSIGKRYRRQDEIGTPYCVTYDFQTAEDQAVTVRDRDTMTQERIGVDKLKQYFQDKFFL